MSNSAIRMWTPAALFVAASLIAIVMHVPARADMAGCNRTAPAVADKQPLPEPLHRCPKIPKKQANDVFHLRGILPFTGDEAQAKADVLRDFAEMCASGLARTERMMISLEKGKDESGRPVWAYLALGECL